MASSGVLFLLTGGFTAALVLQARGGSRMNKASCLLLVGIALTDMLTVAAAIAELVHLYAASAGNHGVLPFHSCHVMYVLERLSAIPHTASIWITVALSVQRYICVAKPFYANRIISMKSSSAIIGVTFLFAGISHVVRFIDGHFEPVNITKIEYPNIIIETCEFRYETWIISTDSYEEAFAWTRVIVIQLIPCILLVAFASLMIKSLYASSKIIKAQIHAGSDKRQSDRRLLSIFVVTVSLIVSVVELAGGVIICLSAVAIYTGTYIRYYTDLNIAAIAMDMLLYISYFCIFIIYCFMSRNFRTRMRQLWDAVNCTYRHRHTSYSSPTKSTSGDTVSGKSKGDKKGSAKDTSISMESGPLKPSVSMETRTTRL